MPLENDYTSGVGDQDPETLLENDNSKDVNLGVGTNGAPAVENAGTPSVAPGISTDDQLEKPASSQEVKRGESTEVTVLDS